MPENTATHPKTRAFHLYSTLLPEVAALGGNEHSIDEAMRDPELLHALALVVNKQATLVRKVVRVGRGMELTFAGDKIIALKCGRFNLELGCQVVANGRHCVPDGTIGYVVKISMPDQNGRSSDIIDVIFHGKCFVSAMKLKDLRPFGREA